MIVKNPIGIIPARGGSKGIVDKNLKLLDGQTLIYRTVKTMLAAIGNAYVTTDSRTILSEALLAGADVIERPKELATDVSSVTDTLRHFCDELNLDDDQIVVLMQCTSPFILAEDVSNCLAALRENPETDLVCSTHHFHGALIKDGKGVLVDPESPNKSQERIARNYDQLNGGVYCFRRSYLRSPWFGGRLLPVRSRYSYFCDIDDKEDLDHARLVFPRFKSKCGPGIAHGKTKMSELYADYL
jgi:CMP-N-acetylneuraminic acid synthetase